MDKASFHLQEPQEVKKVLGLNSVETAIKLAISYKASDIHVKTNRETRIRIKKELKKTDVRVTEQELYDFCRKYMPGDEAIIQSFIDKKIFLNSREVPV